MSDTEDDLDNVEEIEFFKKSVQSFLKLEEELKVLNGAIKQRRGKKKELCETIMAFIQEKDLDSVNLQGDYSGKQMICKTSESRSKFLPEDIQGILEDNLNNPDEASKIYKLIVERQKVKKTTNLRISKPPKQKKKTDKIKETISQNEDTNSEQIPDHLQYLYTI